MKKLSVLLIVLAMLFGMTMNLSANEILDINRSGSITFSMNYDQKPMEGGSLTIYRVGAIEKKTGQYQFVLLESLGGGDVAQDSLDDPKLAEELPELVREKELDGEYASIKNGKAVFFPEYLPYDGMTNVKAQVIGDRLVGENGISLPILETGYIDGPMEDGLLTQEDIDASIAKKHELNEKALNKIRQELDEELREAEKELRQNNKSTSQIYKLRKKLEKKVKKLEKYISKNKVCYEEINYESQLIKARQEYSYIDCVFLEKEYEVISQNEEEIRNIIDIINDKIDVTYYYDKGTNTVEYNNMGVENLIDCYKEVYDRPILYRASR